MMKKWFVLLLTLPLLQLQARVYLGAPFNDGMVLQQESKVLLWGKAAPGASVTITPSWNYKNTVVQANADGRWTARLQTPKGGFTPYAITFNDGESPLVVRDVLVGEVWVATGQSNMEMPLQGWKDTPIDNSAAAIQQSIGYKGKLHFTYTPQALYAKEPQDSMPAQWHDCTPETAKDFSATAYYFATTLINALQVPVGIINCHRGGSNVEAWMPRELLANYSDVDLSDKAYEKMNEHTPAGLYNAKVCPLKGYTIAGFIWYQGESNVGYANQDYANRLATMVSRWRRDWKQGNLPFYFVEIAPFEYGDSAQVRAAFLREQQVLASHRIPNSGMVCTNQLVKPQEDKQIHPSNKQPIGVGLANWALAKTYKKENINYASPEFKSMKIKNGRAYISFTHAKNGFNLHDGFKGFEVCGADRKFVPAKAIVKNGQIVVSSPDVAEPVAVRYCFRNFQIGNLANNVKMPVIPFRTDNFEYQ